MPKPYLRPSAGKNIFFGPLNQKCFETYFELKIWKKNLKNVEGLGLREFSKSWGLSTWYWSTVQTMSPITNLYSTLWMQQVELVCQALPLNLTQKLILSIGSHLLLHKQCWFSSKIVINDYNSLNLGLEDLTLDRA